MLGSSSTTNRAETGLWEHSSVTKPRLGRDADWPSTFRSQTDTRATFWGLLVGAVARTDACTRPERPLSFIDQDLLAWSPSTRSRTWPTSPLCNPISTQFLRGSTATPNPPSSDKVLDTVGYGLGVLYEPVGIWRKARAEASAAITKAKSESEIEVIKAKTEGEVELARIESRDAILEAKERAKERVRRREEQRQENLEAIVSKVAIDPPKSVSEDPVDPDWVAQWLNNCQDVSNERMQGVWARILSGEVAQPGSFSLRTMAVVRTMSKSDAEMFTRFCSLIWEYERFYTRILYPLWLFPEGFPNVPGIGIDLPQLTQLEAMGLIKFDVTGRYRITQAVGFVGPPSQPFKWQLKWRYHGRTFVFSKPVMPANLQEIDPYPLRPADFFQGRRSPGLPTDHPGEQAQPDWRNLAVLNQPLDGLAEERRPLA